MANFTGTSGNDTLVGGSNDDLLQGLGGNDFLDGGFGFDVIDGGAGNDTTTYDFFSGPIVANLATGEVSFPGNSNRTDTLISIENIIGSQGNDTIIGDNGDNRIEGNAGNDLLDGGFGFDIIDGGVGNDTTSYDFFSGPIVANLKKGEVSFPGNSNRTDTLISVENIVGSQGDDKLIGSNGKNKIVGNTGDDRIDGKQGNDLIETGSGDDIVVLHKKGGFDRVSDFEVGSDLIDLKRVQFGELTIQQKGDDVLLKVGKANLMRLEDTAAAALTESSFI